MFRVAGALLGSLALGACGPVPANDRVDGWALTRAALTSGKECFAGRPEYCISDPEFVDAAIRPRLDDLYDGQMPMKRLRVEGTIRAVARTYRRALMRPENIERVEELVKERYASPKITVTKLEVAVDMGVTPGHLEASSPTLSLRMTASPLATAGFWSEREAQRVLAETAAAYPDAPRVRVTVIVPTSKGLEQLVYAYARDERRVLVTDGEGDAWSSGAVGSDGALSTVALKREDLAQCSLDGGHGLPACPRLGID